MNQKNNYLMTPVYVYSGNASSVSSGLIPSHFILQMFPEMPCYSASGAGVDGIFS